jgi:hypothetical protein
MSCDAAYEMRLQVRQAGEVSKAELQLASTATRLQTMCRSRQRVERNVARKSKDADANKGNCLMFSKLCFQPFA